jgi:hypothetical protein
MFSEAWIATVRWVGACVAIAVAWFLLRITTGHLADAGAWWLSTNWLVLFAVTPLLFWIVARYLRRCWSDARFRLVFCGLVIAHFIAHGVLISEFANWKFIWTVILSGIEGPSIVALLSILGFEAEEPFRP